MSGMSCGPCHMIAPVFRKISKDFAGKAYFRKATRWTSDNLFVRCIRCHKNLQMSAFTVTARTLMYIDRWNQILIFLASEGFVSQQSLCGYEFQWFNFGAGFCSSSIPSWKLTLFHPKAFFKMMFPFSRWDLLVLWRVTMKIRWFGRSMWQRTSNWQVSRAFATWCSFVSASCVRHDFVVMLRNIYYVPRGGFSRSLPFCVHIMLHCCELAQSSWQMSSLLRCEKVSFRGSMPTFQFWLRGKKRHQFSGADERAKGETLRWEMGEGELVWFVWHSGVKELVKKDETCWSQWFWMILFEFFLTFPWPHCMCSVGEGSWSISLYFSQMFMDLG